MTFTKEQLVDRIERQIDINATIIERLGDDSAAASELAVKTATMDIKILDVALAALAEPATVVPDAYERDGRGRMMLNGKFEPVIGYSQGWNACRAAMLQAGNSPVIPDGCCIMPMKLTAENGAKGALSCEFHVTHHIVCQSCGGEGCEDCNEEGGWDGEILIGWDIIKQIHDAAVKACSLPAAPQQEV